MIGFRDFGSLSFSLQQYYCCTSLILLLLSTASQDSQAQNVPTCSNVSWFLEAQTGKSLQVQLLSRNLINCSLKNLQAPWVSKHNHPWYQSQNDNVQHQADYLSSTVPRLQVAMSTTAREDVIIHSILSMWEDENNDKIPVYHLHLVIDDDYPASIKLEIKVFFITFTFWGEVRTLKNLSCNLELWWVMRHLEALSCSTCFLVGSQTETSHTFLWPRVFCLVKSRGGGLQDRNLLINLNEIMEISWKSWKYHGNLTEVSWKHRENNHRQIMKFGIKDYDSRF